MSALGKFLDLNILIQGLTRATAARLLGLQEGGILVIFTAVSPGLRMVPAYSRPLVNVC